MGLHFGNYTASGRGLTTTKRVEGSGFFGPFVLRGLF